MQALIQAIMAFQDATSEVDEAAAIALGVNRTDLRCLGVLWGKGPQAPHELADLLFLSRAAVTTVIDRLEKLDLVHRVRVGSDRRRVEVNLTEEGRSKLSELWHPLQEQGIALLATFRPKELSSIERFLRESAERQSLHARRVRSR